MKGEAVHPRARGTRRLVPTVLSVLVSAAFSGPCDAQQRHASTARESAAHIGGGCSAGSIVLRIGEPISPMTGENAQLLALVNRGRRPCLLTGYPDVALTSAHGAVLPFRYRRGGGYVTSARPRPVRLHADGGRAYFIIAKYRCDEGVAARGDARVVRVRPPGAAHVLEATLRAGHYPIFSYCRHPGADPRTDPGNTVVVSPLGAHITTLLP